MVNLSTKDRQRLITVLQDVPELAGEQARRMMLELAGVKHLAPRIDLSGSAFIAISNMVSYLSNYGRVTYEHEALGLLLNTLKHYVGVEQQALLDELLVKYDMMTPIVASPDVSDWHGTESPETLFEKIVGENTLRPLAFLFQGLQVARSVAYVRVVAGPQRWSGTGFLIAPDVLITNHHVLPNADVSRSALFRFNYEENFQGEAQPTYEYRANPDGVFHADAALDYTITQLEGTPGDEWGWLPLRAASIRRNDRVNIIQHPDGQPKHISFQNNFVEYVDSNVVQYVTSTKPGSSGAPVFNDAWEVVALHHAGGNILEPGTQRRYFRNEGILTNRILADVPPELVAALESV